MKRAVILDRDGVINDHRDYVNGPDDFILFPDAADAIGRLNRAGHWVLVATNQGGVGLGYMSLDDLAAVHQYMLRELALRGAKIDDIVFCPHAPRAGCSCRKPKPGLILELHRRHQFDLQNSYMVGDRETDIEAGRAAGTKTVLIGREPTTANHSANTLSEAVDWILQDTTF